MAYGAVTWSIVYYITYGTIAPAYGAIAPAYGVTVMVYDTKTVRYGTVSSGVWRQSKQWGMAAE